MTSRQERFRWITAAVRFFWTDAQRRRRIAAILALAVLILLATRLAVGTWVAHRLSSAAERIVERRGSLELAATLGPPPVAAADNRAKALRAAADLLILTGEGRGRGTDQAFLSGLARFDPGEPSDDSWKRVLAILEKNSMSLQLLDEAARRPAANWEIRYQDGFAHSNPPLLGLLDLARLNLAAGRLELHREHPDAAAGVVLRGLAMVESLRDEPTMIVQLARGALLRFHLALLHEILARAAPSAERLAELSTALDGIEIRRSLGDAFVCDIRAMRDLMLAVDAGRASDGEKEWIDWGPVRWLWRPLAHENLRFYLVTMDHYASRAELPPYRRGADVPPAIGKGLERFYFLAKIAMVNYPAAIERADLWEAGLVLARTALALERRRAAGGSYPERLDELVPGDLDSLPLDPFTGEAPLYERAEGGYRLASAHADAGARADLDPKTPLLWGTGEDPR